MEYPVKHFSLIFITGILICLKCHAQSLEKLETDFNIRDPLAYKSADSMYAVKDTLPFNQVAQKLLATISSQINKGYPIEQDQVWNNLLKLEPFRRNAEVQEAIIDWSKKIARKISRSGKTIKVVTQKEICGLYRSSSFIRATELGRKALLEAPGSLDMRNNLALTQIHLNNDLISQLELEVIRRYDNLYTPGLVNLTVVYERLGKSAEARLIAHSLSKPDTLNPVGLFNAAWYENLDGNYKNADSLLERLTKINKDEKYKSFLKLNKKSLYRNVSIFETGLVERNQLHNNEIGLQGLLIIFGFTILIVWLISLNILRKHISSIWWKLFWFVLFIAGNSLLYLVLWSGIEYLNQNHFLGFLGLAAIIFLIKMRKK